MFRPEYFNVVGYMDNQDSTFFCKKCAEKEWGDGIADVQDELLGRADIAAIYEAEEDQWSSEGEGLFCERCGEPIFEPRMCECDRPEPDRHEEKCEECGGRFEDEVVSELLGRVSKHLRKAVPQALAQMAGIKLPEDFVLGEDCDRCPAKDECSDYKPGGYKPGEPHITRPTQPMIVGAGV